MDCVECRRRPEDLIASLTEALRRSADPDDSSRSWYPLVTHCFDRRRRPAVVFDSGAHEYRITTRSARHLAACTNELQTNEFFTAM